MTSHARAAALTHPSAAPRPRVRHLRAVSPGAPAPRVAVAGLFALGLAIGFVLTALASVAGGGVIVAVNLTLAVMAGGVAVVCAAVGRRARAAARPARRAPARPPHEAAPAPGALRRAA